MSRRATLALTAALGLLAAVSYRGCDHSKGTVAGNERTASAPLAADRHLPAVRVNKAPS